MADYLKYKCPHCGRVHAAIPRTEALRQIEFVNAFRVTEGNLPTASMTPYLQCCVCGTSSADFVPARPGDSQRLATLQGVVIPGVME